MLDAMCLIAMDESSCLESLRYVGASVIIVGQVASQAGLSVESGQLQNPKHRFIEVRSPKRESVPALEQFDTGERESAGLCLEDPDWRFFVTEDRTARRGALNLGLHVIGTGALVWILAVQGRITPDVMRAVLRRVNGTGIPGRGTR